MHDLSRRVVLKSSAAALGVFSLGAGIGASALAAGKIKPAGSAALIVVDVQNCFIEGGTLPVGKGAEVVPVINKLASASSRRTGTPLVTPRLPAATPAKNRLRPRNYRMATRCCGPTIVCKARTMRGCTKT